jgi:hypothetical protein
LIAGVVAGLALGAVPASADVVWLCKPGLAADPCELPLDTTVRSFGQPDLVQRPARDADRAIDCFYVYPTVSQQLGANATKARDAEVVSIAKFQAARFNQHCRVFAPIYRQATLASIYVSAVAPPDRTLAYNDVLEAWRSYLQHDNKGRGVVLIGHSQGTAMLRRLLRQEIDPNPAQQRLVVSGLLLGGNVTVKEGKTVDGDFHNTPLCTERAQLGCVVAFSTYFGDPPANSRFGRAAPPANAGALPGGKGYEVACTDPRPLAGWTDPLRLLTPSEPYALGLIGAGVLVTAGGNVPRADTTWVTPPDRAVGSCRYVNGAHVLRLEPLGASRVPNDFPEPSWGTHLVDVNLALDPLVSLVGQQARRFAHPEVAFTRRCATARRVRLRLTGNDTDLVTGVDFKVGKHRVARDTSAPFDRTIARRALGRRGALRAVVTLARGEQQRRVLARPRPGCAS